MDWEDLRHFLALARTGSLSEAARQLAVDHTTVARRVGALEKALGLRLVDRLPRSYSLTGEGARIAELGARLEDDIFAILRTARGADPAMNGTVRVSAPPVLASAFLAPRLVALHARHPGILVELVGDSRQADLNRREADIALRLSPPGGDSLISRRIGRLGYGPYASPRRPPAGPDEAAALLVYDEGLDHVPQQQWLYVAYPRHRVVFRANDVASLAAAARAGMGIAMLPHFLGRDDAELEILPDPPGAPRPPERDLWLLVHDDLRKAPRVRAVIDHLADVVSRDL
jgi:DNA-binding transcriptional LysR family regulator